MKKYLLLANVEEKAVKKFEEDIEKLEPEISWCELDKIFVKDEE